MKYHDPQNRVQRDDVIQDMMELLLNVTYRLLWQAKLQLCRGGFIHSQHGSLQRFPWNTKNGLAQHMWYFT